MTQVHANLDVEQAVLGAILLYGDPRRALATYSRGLTPDSFYWPRNKAVFTAILALAERQAAIDPLTVSTEIDRLNLSERVERGQVDVLASCAPAAGSISEYADRVIELARWRAREAAAHALAGAVQRRDEAAFGRASEALETAVAGTRTDTLSGEAWRDQMFDYYATPPEIVAAGAVPFPIERINDGLGGGLRPGEVCVLGGSSGHGKSLLLDSWADHASKHGKRGHLYLTEMAAIPRGMRYIARRTGIPFMRHAKAISDLLHRQRRVAKQSNDLCDLSL